MALMRLGDEAYGVPISREIEQRSGREVLLGSVYAALERLEEKGLRDVRQTQRALINLWKGLPELKGGMA